MVWNLAGTARQQELVRAALTACSFPFDQLAASLAREGKTAIDVTWEDLSRYSAQLEQKSADDHQHFHDGDAEVSPVIREVEGRQRVLGLFYLPPYTRIVLDSSLEGAPQLAQEVFLAEAAHAVDYHHMDNEMRLAVWNALHPAAQLPAGTVIPESGDVDHGHSWFDGPAGYATWVGEAFMEVFVAAFAPAIPVTIRLAHPVSSAAAAAVRAALVPEPETPPVVPREGEEELAAALRRFLRSKGCPNYLREPAARWLID